jgi:predicted O-methyltransferase YrrM
MSEASRTVTEGHFAYLSARTLQEDDFLRELKVAAQAAGIPRIWVSPEQAAFLEILLRAARVKEVVEVGSLAGYAAIRMARAIGSLGRVRTLEIDPDRADFAERWVAESDVAGRVEVHRGDARDTLRGFADDSADAAFIDADKQGYETYIRECLRIVRLGGLILVDNAFAFGQLLDESATDPDVPAIRAVNDAIAAHPQIRGIIVPFADGCWVGVKVAPA